MIAHTLMVAICFDSAKSCLEMLKYCAVGLHHREKINCLLIP